MKNYMSKFLFALLSVGMLMATGCKDNEEKVETALDDIVLNYTRYSYSGQIDLPELSTISNYWHTYSPTNDQWLTYEVIPGRRALYIYVDGNTTGKARSSYIMIRCGYQDQRIVVNQDTESRLLLSNNSISVGYKPSVREVTLTNYTELDNITLAIDGNPDWLTANLENDIIKISAERNSTTEMRETIINVSAIRKISGDEVSANIAIAQMAGGVPYAFELPDFSASNVYQVIDKETNKPVAQIAREFLSKDNLVNAQAVVVYPVNDQGAVELGKGYVAQILKEGNSLTNGATTTYATPAEGAAVHGGTVAFSVADNEVTSYIPGEETAPVTKVYMIGTYISNEPDDSKETIVEPVLIDDVRDTEHYTYPVVKIATQYWMAENLKTARYNANKSFEAIPTGLTADQTKKPFVVVIDDADVNNIAGNATLEANREKYGLLYSYAALGGIENPSASVPVGQAIADNISPNGWIVPTFPQYETLLAYVKWSLLLGHLEDGATVEDSNNITGFNAIKQKYYYPAAGFTASTSFYTTFASRTRAEDNGSNARYSALILKEDIATGHVAPARNRVNFDRCMPIRCLNNGAIKLAE